MHDTDQPLINRVNAILLSTKLIFIVENGYMIALPYSWWLTKDSKECCNKPNV